MASEFLKRMSESLEKGKPDDVVKAVYNEILDKADRYASNPDTMKSIEEKANSATEKTDSEIAKKLTAEEVINLNLIAKQEQDKMLANEQKLIISSTVNIINSEIDRLEQKIVSFKKRIGMLEGNVPYEEKKKIIDAAIREIND